ncbi:DegV family protein [Acholeplasma equirhinis]|uniref:DegV family protein n=1 Tax=Acholeplasma equirhinis TaxID=555393 RepID=UPI00197ACDAE|nr:DegV family protein [Acholeplasma equirhinis]MBN3490078.1 DegV family protein [Acholeplasma equirhinis]
MQKIAILADSGSDINNFKKGSPLYILPLRIVIDGVEYIDKKEISLTEVLSKLDTHKVTTSLPSPKDIESTLDQIKADGFTHVIVIPISKGLSGTMNVIRTIVEDYEGLEISIIDTKNISMASGYSSIEALEMIEQGKSYSEIVDAINTRLTLKKVFFTVDKLIYLKRGGRIGLVSATIADLLKIKPVITCNEDGVYYSVKKQRGYEQAVKQLINLVSEFVGDASSYDLSLMNADSKLDLEKLQNQIKEALPKVRNIEVSNITPALAIHTGPEALGIAVKIND